MERLIPGKAAAKPRAFATSFGSILGAAALASLFVAAVTGCGGKKKFGTTDDDTKQLIHYVRTTYLRAGQPIECTAAKITEVTPISDELFEVTFDAEATLIKATYVQLDKVRLLANAGWDEAAYVAAMDKVRNLPADARTTLDKLRPAIDGNTRFYRNEANEGQQLNFQGRCHARWQATTWNLSELDLKELTTPEASALSLYDLNQYKVSVLPPNSWEITGVGGQQRIKSFVTAQKQYVAAVTEASAKMVQEQSDSAAKLVSVASTGKTWTASLPDGNRADQKWIIEFIDVAQGEVLKALVRHPTDELRRRIYSGRVITGNPASIVMEPVDEMPGLIYGGNRPELLRIRMVGDDLRIFVNDNIEGRLAPTPAVANTKPEAELWADLMRLIEPGTQWSGTARTGSDAAVPIKLTFVEVKPDGSYVRAVGESPSDPATMVVFEGIANRASVHGWPLVMKATDSYAAEGQKRDYFAAGNSTLVLAMLEDRLIGHRGADALQFASKVKLNPWAGRDQVASRILSPGMKLSGRVEHSEGSTEIDLTIAEVRDNGAYVRVLVQAKEDPYDSAVYEGRFPFHTPLIDGYALELKKRSSLKRTETLFNDESQAVLRLRLAIDGSSVIGVLSVSDQPRETMLLKVDETRKAAVDLATGPFAAHIKQLLVKNSQWRGTIRDLREARSAEVQMKITDVSVADGITAEFTVPRTAGARAVYEGVLQLGDLTVNTNCATLRKTLGGKAEKSAIFDSSVGEDRKMKFTLSPDGITLYVQTVNGSGERMEQLMLKPVIVNRPPGITGGTSTSGLPGTPAGTSTGTRPVSGLLRPVTP